MKVELLLKHFTLPLVILFLLIPYNAIGITYNFTGIIDDITYHQLPGQESLPISKGDSLNGSFTYNYDPIAPLFGSYVATDLFSYHIQMNNFEILGSASAATYIQIGDNVDHGSGIKDEFYFLDEAAWGVYNGTYIDVSDSFVFSFVDSSATVFENTSLPITLDLSAFDQLNFGFQCYDYDNYSTDFGGHIDSFTLQSEPVPVPVPVPEPSTMLLLGFGLILTGLWKKIRN